MYNDNYMSALPQTPPQAQFKDITPMSKTNSLNEYIFGSLGKEYCLYFYLISFVSYFVFIFIVLYLLFMVVTNFKKVDSKLIGALATASAYWFILYFQNRLLHTMCVEAANKQQ